MILIRKWISKLLITNFDQNSTRPSIGPGDKTHYERSELLISDKSESSSSINISFGKKANYDVKKNTHENGNFLTFEFHSRCKNQPIVFSEQVSSA